MKSPNMMSTTGRMPVMAPPTPSPVIPASEIGESITRAGPNSSTRPESTLKTVPASATSSPIMNTRGSRRISSANASRIAWPSVISRICRLLPDAERIDGVLSIDILIDLARFWERSTECELDSCCNFGTHSSLHLFESFRIGHMLLDQPRAEELQWVTLGHPLLFFLFRAVVRALNVA